MKLSQRVTNLKPSIGFELLKTAKEMKAKGEDVISLAIGELQGKTYAPLRKAGQEVIAEGNTKYGPSAGLETLREKLAKEAQKQWNIPLDSENVYIGNGCKYVLYTAFQSLCDKGEEVILPSPYWMSYPPLISFTGASLKVLDTKAENNFKVTAEELDQAITEKTKVFLLNSPNNPTSAVYTEEELKALGEVLIKQPQVIVMFDGIYDRLIYSGQSFAPHLLKVCPELKDRLLAFNGASKNYLMTGWRLGWVIAPKRYVKVFSAFQSQSAGCANVIGQGAFERAFQNCEKDISRTIQELKIVRDSLYEEIKNIPGLKIYPSEGAFYFWVGVKNFIGKSYKGHLLKSSKDIMEQLLKHKKLVCICGEEFGRTDYIRLSYVTPPEEIKRAGERLREFFSELT